MRKIAGRIAAASLTVAVLMAENPAQGALFLQTEIPDGGPPLTVVAAPEEPNGYRMNRFRAPTPAGLEGATVVSTDEAQRLWRGDSVVFIDVLPRPPKPENLPEDVIWRVPPRDNIPGGVWLPNVGFGSLLPKLEGYFRGNLNRLSDGDKDAAMVFYCLADCWMSWNAAKRALEFGYTNVYWYPEGTDGWSAGGHELERSEPVPMQP